MEHAAERRHSSWWYALPVVGALIMLARRGAHREVEAESKEQMLLDESNLGLTQALNIGLKYMPGTPVEVELEEEHGMPVWKVEIVPRKGGAPREIIIDAANGDVLEMRTEFPEETKSRERGP